jgi:hypothetical protein
MNDPAFGESKRGQKLLHDLVVRVRIDSQMPALFKGPSDAEPPDSPFGAIGGQFVGPHWLGFPVFAIKSLA